HHEVGPLGDLGDTHNLEAVGFGLLGRGGIGTQSNRHFLHARILEIKRMRPALAAIADDGNLLALAEVEIGVAIVIDTHFRFPSFRLNLDSLNVVVLPGPCHKARILGPADAGFVPWSARNCRVARLASCRIVAAVIFMSSPRSRRICTSRPTRPKKVRNASSASSKARSPALRPASSTGFNRSPIAKRPLARTISPRLLLPEPAWATATRLSAIDVSEEITSSQATAKLSRLSRSAATLRCWLS